MNIKSIPSVLVSLALFLFPFCTTAAAQTYALEISREPADSGVYHVEPDQDSYAPATRVTVSAGPFPGFEFVGWEGDISTAGSELTFVMTADTSLTAVFQAVGEATAEFELLVVSDPQGAGWVTRDPARAAYTPDDEVTLTAVPATGYAFAGWIGDVPDDANLNRLQLVVSVNDDRDITAHFEAAATVDPGDGAGGTQGSAGCGMLGMLFWPMTALGLAAIRRR